MVARRQLGLQRAEPRPNVRRRLAARDTVTPPVIIMAVFGAPISLEDHAIRACLAALDIQRQASDLAAGVRQRDGIDLQLRVGLNSGEVIAGEVGSRAGSYTTIGDQVGMAQRMESVASAGGVMVE